MFLKVIQGVLIVFSLMISVNTYASPDYQALVDDISQRLDKTLALYEEGQITTAKRTVQMAYFEVFENLEGPIRINYSADLSYQLESKFGFIRKLITNKAPLAQVENEILTLKKALQALPEALKNGHQIVAQSRHDLNDEIAPYWLKQIEFIDERLGLAVIAYKTHQYEKTKAYVRQAQYSGYKNSELETYLGIEVSGAISAAFNRRFKVLLDLCQSDDQLIEFGYQTSNLVLELNDFLPGLKVPQSQKTQENNPLEQSKDWDGVKQQILGAFSDVLVLQQKGKTQDAIFLVQDTYFDLFEASDMEAKIGARDATFKAELESSFTKIVSLIRAGKSVRAIEDEIDKLEINLNIAVQMLSKENQTPWSLFLYSLMIIVREGLEAMLVVAAIIAYLIKNKHEDKLTIVKNSVVVALVASVVTALIFKFILDNSGAKQEILEGVTMLLAALVLFFVSYWLIAKAEASRWKAYIDGKLSKSLSTGSIIGLWFASFLSVYREGAETALFYYALILDAQLHGYWMIAAGFACGCIILLLCYLIIRYSVVKLPLRPFFIFTSALLYLMAFVFAGKGVLELIEGKVFQPHLVSDFPQITVLGIFPYVETLIPQVVILLAAFFALYLLKKNKVQEIV
ncbi:high-affinity Fe2+/Pb2+ permease [Psychromonas sp. CNPT3]|uniref:FTR1 family iron permease n=1 Tax=Psychromonas sp. CNPT3 TaxID=314282 RepID=UPI00006E9E43|nr:FTR1 family protein [Psychromonas sp. CNPT3]AGH82368.1 high-affinity Fe2+/Pb2+ permease [Psychromonas sp. CNPT3]